MKKRIIAAFSAIVIILSLSSCNTKKIPFSFFDGNFSPFFVRGVQDLSVMAMTQESLLVKTEDEDGQTSPVFDAYSQGLGIADIDIEYFDNRAVCTINLGQDIYFSDGVQMTSKDVAFSMYVYAQADYDGWSILRSSPLDGLIAYRYGTDEAERLNFETAALDAELANPSERTKELIRSRIIYPVLRQEYYWVTHLYGDEAYIGTDVENHVKKYPDPRALFAYYYALDTDYDALSAADAQTVISDIAAQYDADYKTLGIVYGNSLDSMARDCAKQALTEEKLKNSQTVGSVTSIRGIQIINDFTLSVTINSIDPDDIENVLGIYVAPFHYYGQGCSFDGTGFKIDLDSVAQKSSEPLGAGRFIMKKYTPGKGVSFKANKNYYRDISIEKSVYFYETGNSNISIDNEYFTIIDDRMLVKNNS